MAGWLDFLRREKKYVQQSRELAAAREELANLREQTERMRAGMRRCITCDYRREVIALRSSSEAADEIVESDELADPSPAGPS